MLKLHLDEVQSCLECASFSYCERLNSSLFCMCLSYHKFDVRLVLNCAPTKWGGAVGIVLVLAEPMCACVCMCVFRTILPATKEPHPRCQG